MSASRASAAALLLAACLAAGPAGAQSGEPLQLWRPAPQRVEPDRAEPGQAMPERAAPQPPEAPVETAPLEPLNRESLGLLEGRRGLGAELWAGSDRAEIASLIQALPARIDSAALHGLARRLLLTAGKAPGNGAGDDSLIALRVAALATLGAVEDAAALLAAAGPREDDPVLARLGLDLALLRYDLPAACETVRAGVARHPDPYWQKALAFCQAEAGERDQARLGAGLLREAKEEDAAFFALLDMMLGDGPEKMPPLSDPAPLHLAMLRAAGKPVPAELLTDAKPALLRSIALSPNAGLEVRIEAAERAVAAQALDPKALADLYAKAGAGAPPPDDPPKSWTPQVRAALSRAAAGEQDLSARAGMLQRAWAEARERGGYEALVRAALPLIEPMQPGGRLGFFAEDAARAWLLAGQPARARDWAGIARREAEGNPRAARGAALLAPLIALADPKAPPWTDEAMARWQELQRDRDPERAPRRMALVFTLFDALGRPLPQKVWAALRGDLTPRQSTMPAPRVWQGMQAAAAEKRRGEAVLYALLAASASEDAWTNPQILQGVIRALRQVGLQADARALAVEAALAAGV